MLLFRRRVLRNLSCGIRSLYFHSTLYRETFLAVHARSLFTLACTVKPLLRYTLILFSLQLVTQNLSCGTRSISFHSSLYRETSLAVHAPLSFHSSLYRETFLTIHARTLSHPSLYHKLSNSPIPNTTLLHT